MQHDVDAYHEKLTQVFDIDITSVRENDIVMEHATDCAARRANAVRYPGPVREPRPHDLRTIDTQQDCLAPTAGQQTRRVRNITEEWALAPGTLLKPIKTACLSILAMADIQLFAPQIGAMFCALPFIGQVIAVAVLVAVSWGLANAEPWVQFAAFGALTGALLLPAAGLGPVGPMVALGAVAGGACGYGMWKTYEEYQFVVLCAALLGALLLLNAAQKRAT